MPRAGRAQLQPRDDRAVRLPDGACGTGRARVAGPPPARGRGRAGARRDGARRDGAGVGARRRGAGVGRTVLALPTAREVTARIWRFGLVALVPTAGDHSLPVLLPLQPAWLPVPARPPAPRK